MGQAGDSIGSALRAIGDEAARQFGGTFLHPGSSFSVAALAVSLVVFLALVLRGKRPRTLRPAVLRRALFPNRLVASASGRADLAYFVGGILLSGVAIGWAVIAATAVQRGVAPWLGMPAAPWLPGWAAIALTTLIGFVAYEFAYWLDHFLKHRSAILWQFHKVHHRAESLSLLTNGRVHPVDTIVFYNIVAVTMGLAGALGQRLFGTGTDALTIGGTNALLLLAAVALGHLQHSHLWLRFGPRWGRILLGPAHHQIHHSAAPEHHDRNLGNTLACFDRAFGTFTLPDARRGAIRFGVDDGERAPHGVRAALFQPFADAAGLLVAPLARAFRRRRPPIVAQARRSP